MSDNEDFLTEDYAGTTDDTYNLGVEEEDILLADDDHIHHDNHKQLPRENGAVFVDKPLAVNGPAFVQEIHKKLDVQHVHEPIHRKHGPVLEPIHLQVAQPISETPPPLLHRAPEPVHHQLPDPSLIQELFIPPEVITSDDGRAPSEGVVKESRYRAGQRDRFPTEREAAHISPHAIPDTLDSVVTNEAPHQNSRGRRPFRGKQRGRNDRRPPSRDMRDREFRDMRPGEFRPQFFDGPPRDGDFRPDDFGPPIEDFHRNRDFRHFPDDRGPMLNDFRPHFDGRPPLNMMGPAGDFGPLQDEFRLPGEFRSPGEFRPPQGEFRPPGEFRPSQGDFRPPPGEFRLPGEFRPPQGEFRPPQGEFRPPQGEFRPPPEFRSLQGEFRPPPGEFRPPQGEFRPSQGDFRPGFGPSQDNFRPPGEFRPQQGEFIAPPNNIRPQGNFRPHSNGPPGNFRPQGDFRPRGLNPQVPEFRPRGFHTQNEMRFPNNFPQDRRPPDFRPNNNLNKNFPLNEGDPHLRSLNDNHPDEFRRQDGGPFLRESDLQNRDLRPPLSEVMNRANDPGRGPVVLGPPIGVSIPPRAEGTKVLINPHFKGTVQAGPDMILQPPPLHGDRLMPLQGPPLSFIPGRELPFVAPEAPPSFGLSGPPNRPSESYLGPKFDLDKRGPVSEAELERLAEQFINEQKRCLERAQVAKKDDFFEKTQRFIENTSIEPRSEVIDRDKDRERERERERHKQREVERLRRAQEQFIQENQTQLNLKRRRDASPPSTSPHKRQRTPSPNSPHQNQDPEEREYRVRLREQAEMRARVLQAKERRRRRDAATRVQTQADSSVDGVDRPVSPKPHAEKDVRSGEVSIRADSYRDPLLRQPVETRTDGSTRRNQDNRRDNRVDDRRDVSQRNDATRREQAYQDDYRRDHYRAEDIRDRTTYRQEERKEQAAYRAEDRRDYRLDDRKDPLYKADERKELMYRADQPNYRTDERREYENAYRPDDRREQVYRTDGKKEQPYRQEQIYVPDDRRDQTVYKVDEVRDEHSYRKDDRREQVYRAEDDRDTTYRTEDRRDPVNFDKKDQAPYRSDDRRDQQVYRADERREQTYRMEDRKEQLYREERREQQSYRADDKKDQTMYSSKEESKRDAYQKPEENINDQRSDNGRKDLSSKSDEVRKDQAGNRIEESRKEQLTQKMETRKEPTSRQQAEIKPLPKQPETKAKPDPVKIIMKPVKTEEDMLLDEDYKREPTLDEMLEDDTLRLSPEEEDLLLSDGESHTPPPINRTKPSAVARMLKVKEPAKKVLPTNTKPAETKPGSKSTCTANSAPRSLTPPKTTGLKRTVPTDTKQDLRTKLARGGAEPTSTSSAGMHAPIVQRKKIIYSGNGDKKTEKNDKEKSREESPNKWRSTFTEQKLERTAPIAARAISAVIRDSNTNKRKVLAPQSQKSSEPPERQTDEPTESKGIFSGRRVVVGRSTATTTTNRVVLPRKQQQQPLVIVEKEDIEMEPKGDTKKKDLKDDKNCTAIVSGLPPGMTEARLLSLCGPEVEQVIMSTSEQNGATARFMSAEACGRFVRRFNGRLVAACCLKVRRAT